MYFNCCARRARTTNSPSRKISAEYGDASQSPLTIREWPLSNLKNAAFVFVSAFNFQTKVTSIGAYRNIALQGIG
jgi:hypothetical protein